jgi:hypothetical protein
LAIDDAAVAELAAHYMRRLAEHVPRRQAIAQLHLEAQIVRRVG